MKVRSSQIPEDNGKPQYPDNRMKKTSGYSIDDEEEDSDEDEGYRKKFVNFKDVGIAISLFGIESIEKKIKFLEKPKAHWEYGIVINQGIEPSIRFPKVDVEIWFLTEEVRDKRWDSMLEVLKEERFNVIDI